MMPDDHISPPATLKLRCGYRRCTFIGAMRVHQTSPGCHGSIAGPPEPPMFAATCPKCSRVQDLDGDEQPCDHCGLVVEPDRIGQLNGDRLCTWCWYEAWDRWVVELANGVGVPS